MYVISPEMDFKSSSMASMAFTPEQVMVINAILFASYWGAHRSNCMVWKHRFSVFLKDDGSLDWIKILGSFRHDRNDVTKPGNSKVPWHGYTAENDEEAKRALKNVAAQMDKMPKCGCKAVSILGGLLDGNLRRTAWKMFPSLEMAKYTIPDTPFPPKTFTPPKFVFDPVFDPVKILMSITTSAELWWFLWLLALEFSKTEDLKIFGSGAGALLHEMPPGDLDVTGSVGALELFLLYLVNVFKVTSRNAKNPKQITDVECLLNDSSNSVIRLCVEYGQLKVCVDCVVTDLMDKFRDSGSDFRAMNGTLRGVSHLTKTKLVYKGEPGWLYDCANQKLVPYQQSMDTIGDVYSFILRLIRWAKKLSNGWTCDWHPVYDMQCQSCKLWSRCVRDLPDDLTEKIQDYLGGTGNIPCTCMFPIVQGNPMFRFPCCNQTYELSTAHKKLSDSSSCVPGNKAHMKYFSCGDCNLHPDKQQPDPSRPYYPPEDYGSDGYDSPGCGCCLGGGLCFGCR